MPEEDTGFQPDFTSPDPYAGAPPGYAEEVAESFVPTEDNPINPVEAAQAAGQDVGQAFEPSGAELPTEGLPIVEGFTPEEYQPVLGDTPPEVWELRGYTSGRYDTPQGRQEVLEDIQRSRESVAATQAAIAAGTYQEPEPSYGEPWSEAQQVEYERALASGEITPSRGATMKMGEYQMWKASGIPLETYLKSERIFSPEKVKQKETEETLAEARRRSEADGRTIAYHLEQIQAEKVAAVKAEEAKKAIVYDYSPEQQEALGKLQAFKVEEGYDIAQAIKDGLINIVKQAGFTEEQIQNSLAQFGKEFVAYTEEQQAILAELEPYKVAGTDNYDIAQAIREGKIEAVRKAGFDPLAIVDAQKQAAELPTELIEPQIREAERIPFLPKPPLPGFEIGTRVRQQGQIKDILAEIMTVGQIKTLTFNEKDIAEQYNKEVTLAKAIYNGEPDKVEALYKDETFDPGAGRYLRMLETIQFAEDSKQATGVPTETEQEYLNRAIGSPQNYTKVVIASQPLVGELAKEFIPFRQFTPGELAKMKDATPEQIMDFMVKTAFDIAIVIPIAGWIAKGASVGLKMATTGAKITALGGKMGESGVLILRNQAALKVEEVIGEISTKTLALKTAKKAVSTTQKELTKAITQKAPKETIDALTIDLTNRKDALKIAQELLNDAKSEHAQRVITARANFNNLDQLLKDAAKSPVQTAMESRAYSLTTKGTTLAAKATIPAWRTAGTAQLVMTTANWEKSSPIERTIGLAMVGISYGMLGKVTGAIKSGYEIISDIERIPHRVISVPEAYLPREAGMPKTSIKGMTLKEQMTAMETRSKALEDLWQGKGKANYPWGETGLRYAPRSEFQKIIPKSMIHTTPTGEAFNVPVYKVVTLREPAQYFAPWGFPEFAEASATGIRGKNPAYLVLFGEKISDYPSFIAFARSPFDMRKLTTRALNNEALRQGAYPGFKQYAKALEPEYILPKGTEVGAVKGGMELWTRATPFGKKIRLQPHYVIDELEARRLGFTLPEALMLRTRGIHAELKHWIEKAKFWERGIAKEEGIIPKLLSKEETAAAISGRERLAQARASLYRGSNTIGKDIEKAKMAKDEVLANMLTKIRNRYSREPKKIDALYDAADVLRIELESRSQTPRVMALLRELRELEALRVGLYRTLAISMLGRAREEVRTSRELRLARIQPQRAELARPEPTRPELVRPEMPRVTISRVKIPRIELPREPSRIELARVEIPRVEVPRVEIPRIEIPRIDIPRIDIPKIEIPPEEPPKLILIPEGEERERIPTEQYPITWQVSRIGGWITIHPPYGQKDVERTKEKPTGAQDAGNQFGAIRTIQSIGGDASAVFKLTIDQGVQDIEINSPSREVGKRTTIEFRKDPYQRTRGDITLKGVKFR